MYKTVTTPIDKTTIAPIKKVHEEIGINYYPLKNTLFKATIFSRQEVELK